MKVSKLVFLLVLVSFQALAQQPVKITVHVENASLNEVLLSLKERYGLQFAYDKDLLSQYTISVNRSFDSEEETLVYLLKTLPLELEKSGHVFLIYPEVPEQKVARQKKITQISGQVMEIRTYEPLPFSYIFINNKSIQSDRQGHFSYLASADSTFDVRISHLGYFIYDTLVTGNLNTDFLLTPHIEQLNEVVVEGNPVEKSTLIGDRPGKIKINHRIAPILPGYGDNSVFNLLRLMPGILASGEQSNDLLIWGSYESHSKIQFDGFTVFGLKNFNDNISVVNPFVVKNIDVYKGGYEARFGGRVGGIVDITGKNGSLQKPAFTFNINNTTVNSLLEIPLSGKSSLLAAYRQTYYQLYDPTQLNLFRNNTNSRGNGPGGPQSTSIDFTVKPDYVFRDANLKYAFNGTDGSEFFISVYGGGDKFSYNMDSSIGNYIFIRSEKEQNQQLGGAVFLRQPWENGNATSFTASYSVFQRSSGEENRVENQRMNLERVTRDVQSENNVDEISFKTEHLVPFRNGNQLLIGAGVLSNNVKLLRQSPENEIINLNSSSPRIFGYLQNDWPVAKFLNLSSGLRTIFASGLNQWYAEPRVLATVHLTKEININASWGLFNQFMAKTSLVDSIFNYSYFWTNSDNESIPVLSGRHLVGGLSYTKNGFIFSAEAYHKTTSGITRFFNGTQILSRGFYQGEGRSYGLDFFLKKHNTQLIYP